MNTFMQAIQDVMALMQLAPSILQMIVQVEGIFGPETGPLKKTAIMNTVAEAPASLQSHVANFIDSTVKTMNEAGKLGTTAKTVADAVAAAAPKTS